MKIMLLSIIVFLTAIPSFSKDIQAIYAQEKATKSFDIIKYYKNREYDPEKDKYILMDLLNKEQINDQVHYYKAVLDPLNRLIRLEEYKENKIFGLYMYFYDNELDIHNPSTIQYHYFGHYNLSNKDSFFYIKLDRDPENCTYTIEYYQNNVLVKRELYKQSGELLQIENINIDQEDSK